MQRNLSFLPNLCYQYGVRYAVICPGSRSAPLVGTFVNSDIQCLSIVDERSAAYFALGIAIETLSPVVIICTSGTAALNFAPAMAEAYYQRVPLVAITADRPKESIGNMEGQAIWQNNIYQNFSLYNADIDGDLFIKGFPQSLITPFLDALEIANGNRKGPVHLNIRFSEPLYNLSFEKNDNDGKLEIKTQVKLICPNFSEEELGTKKQLKVLFLAGMDFRNEVSSKLIDILEQSGIVTLSEPLANIQSNKPIRNFDLILTQKIDALKPDLVITHGLGLVSKRVRLWLRSHSEIVHWHIDIGNENIDTFRHLKKVWKCSVEQFFAEFVQFFDVDGTYHLEWKKKSQKVNQVAQEFIPQSDELTDFEAFSTLFENFPKEAIIHAGNSTPIRYVNLFSEKLSTDTKVLSNRGTSGIDGSTSTAAGVQFVNKSLNVLITGDLSFHYDINGLWNHYLKPNFRIIIINNQGGNIFRLIEGPSQSGNLEVFYETLYRYNAYHLAQHFGLDYYFCDSKESLKTKLNDFWESTNSPKILEVKTGNKSSEEVFKQYISFIKNNTE